MTRESLVDMSKLFVEIFLKSFEQPPEEIILDVDATDDPIHGQQEGRFYHGDYRHDCFLPWYVFCGGHLLCALLRPANIDPAKHSRALVKLLVDRIRAEWPDVKIIVRGDMENRIKEQQLMRFADRTSCRDFLSNQFRLLLSSFADVLLHHLRSEHLPDTELAPAQADRLRLSLGSVDIRVTFVWG